MRIPPALAAFAWAYDRTSPGGVAAMTSQDIERGRRALPSRGPARLVVGSLTRGVTWTDVQVAGDAGPVAARVYRPAGGSGPRPLVVHLHGGGWVLGNATSAGWLCTGVAAALDAVVVSVEYRMAPEHRAPAAALDCYAAVADVVASSTRFGIDPARVAVMGDSAGGNLSAVVCQVARDRGGPAIAAQALIYPGTDATLASPSLYAMPDAPILTLADIRAFLAHYLGPDGYPKDPLVSPLLAADLTRLPPALVQTAEKDPLLDDGRRYAGALAEAGVPVRHTTYVGMPHGFMSMPGLAGRSAAQARAEIVEHLRTAFSRT